MRLSSNPKSLPAPPKAFTGQDLGEAALRGFFQIAGAWGLSTAEQRILLGEPPRSTFFAWKKAPKVALAKDTLERVSYVLGIWKALRILIPDDRLALAWVKKPNGNPMFGGQPPVARMLQGRILDLADVRRLLDARRGVW